MSKNVPIKINEKVRQKNAQITEKKKEKKKEKLIAIPLLRVGHYF